MDKVERKIKELENKTIQAINDGESLNTVVNLLDLCTSLDDPRLVLKAIYALYRVFANAAEKQLLVSSRSHDEDQILVHKWFSEKLELYAVFLRSLLKDEEQTLRNSALQILMTLLKHLSVTPVSEAESKPPALDTVFFRKLSEALLTCPPSQLGSVDRESDGELANDVRDLFVDTWLNVYTDIRFHFLKTVASLLSTPSFISTHPTAAQNALSILESFTTMSESNMSKWWIDSLATSPFKSSSSSSSSNKATTSSTPALGSDDEDEDEDEEPDDWRLFFDAQSSTDASKDPKSKSKSKDKSKDKAYKESRRIHTLSIHQQLHHYPAHRVMFTKCWLSLLPLLSAPSQTTITIPSSPSPSLKKRKRSHLENPAKVDASEKSLDFITRALNVFHRGVLPHLTRAVLVMDWVSTCVDNGGVVGLLALNTLFVLMRDYKLDYPQFYTRLYAFLDKSVLHVKVRSRFFRLLELFLSSTHLSATILASFLKRLARLSLSAPPAAITIIVPFTYNVLKKHPALMVMIHRIPQDSESESESDSPTPAPHDPYNPTHPDPSHTNALSSSLWELYTHTRHYHSVVSALAKVFEEAFTKPVFGMEDFLDHAYSTMLDTELKRKIKHAPAVIDDFTSLTGEKPVVNAVVHELWAL